MRKSDSDVEEQDEQEEEEADERRALVTSVEVVALDTPVALLLRLGRDVLRLILRCLEAADLYAVSCTCTTLRRLAVPLCKRALATPVAVRAHRKAIAKLVKRVGGHTACSMLYRGTLLSKRLRVVQSAIYESAKRALHGNLIGRNRCDGEEFEGRWSINVLAPASMFEHLPSWRRKPTMMGAVVSFKLNGGGFVVQASKILEGETDAFDKLPDVRVACTKCGRSLVCKGSPSNLTWCVRVIVQHFDGEYVTWWKLPEKV